MLAMEGARLVVDGNPWDKPVGLSLNGLSYSGLSKNGLNHNGLLNTGLSENGFAASSFREWFNDGSTALSDEVMRYVVRCALAKNKVLTWLNPVTQEKHSWSGGLGLAPDWASGNPATEKEQQIITACLAAHVNKYGAQIPISILGETAQGIPLGLQEGEREVFSLREGAFFGNLFQEEGAFACQDSTFNIPPQESSLRTCADFQPGKKGESQCTPLQVVGFCNGALRCELDATRTYFHTCQYQGKTYRALTTHLRPLDFARCGDGVCQLSESCGAGHLSNSCAADCGPCP
ncbi:MAG TPA: hypothetical protein VFZ09_14930 [Archangium sp.]|uniref:hypothetical protein n=1 Tax=Archangium sp. TaxID=1872627 RepID=UPI002E330BE1|nr:hypothetical protein [Archangium sp.]HEX5747538.1 hypothetical protein [Archangium sp.]